MIYLTNVFKNVLLIGVVLFLLTGFFLGHSPMPIKMKGYFYREIPYQIDLPKEIRYNKLGFLTKGIDVSALNYDSSIYSLRLNFRNDGPAFFNVYDSLHFDNILEIEANVKAPPISILLNGKYISGDTIPLRACLGIFCGYRGIIRQKFGGLDKNMIWA